MMKKILTFLPIILLFIVTSCNLRPVYSNSNQAKLKISYSLSISGTKNAKSNYHIKKAFDDMFEKTTDSRYSVEINVTEGRTNFAAQSNTTFDRSRVDLTADLVIRDRNDPTYKSKEKVMVSDSFEITNSPYSSLVSEEGSVEILSENLAKEVLNRIISVTDIEN